MWWSSWCEFLYKGYGKVIDHSGENIISVYISELENPIEWKEIKNWFIEKDGEWK